MVLLVNETLANVTGNLTGEPSQANWIAQFLSWIFNAVKGFISSFSEIFQTNMFIGIILLAVFLMILFFVLSWGQEAGSRFMKFAVIILLIIFLVAVIWLLQTQFQLNIGISNWLGNFFGMGNVTGNATQNITNITTEIPPGRTDFWV